MKAISSLLFVMLITFTHTSTSAAQAKVIVGRVEKVRIYPGNLLINAKLDTGAKTSSLDYDHISVFEHDGGKWVRFSVMNYKGRTITLERKVHRVAKIKRHLGKIQERYVVKLGLCLGTVYREAEVNLRDRTGFNYKMLIGRNFMEDNFIVDPSLKYTTKPNCKGSAGSE